MKMEFNLQRSVSLFLRDIYIMRSSLLIGLIANAFFGGYCLLTTNNPYHSGLYVYLCCMQVAIIMICFREYQKKLSEEQNMLLPVSNLERYISEFVKGFIVLPICFLISLIVGIFLIGIIQKAVPFIFGTITFSEIFNTMGAVFPMYGRMFLECYSIFALSFFGAIFYKRYAVVKMFLLMFSIGCFTMMIVASIFFHYFAKGNTFNPAIFQMLEDSPFIAHTISIIYSLFLMFLAYLRLTEREDK